MAQKAEEAQGAKEAKRMKGAREQREINCVSASPATNVKSFGGMKGSAREK